MKKGDWVILEKFTHDTAYEGKEGEIVGYYQTNDGYKIRLKSGVEIFCKAKNMRVIQKHINYSELLDIALSPLDKPWIEQITQKIKRLS